MKEKKVVLVTGSSTGFGKLTVETLARAGYAVRATMRNVRGSNRAAAADLEGLAKAENLDLKVVELDILDSESVKAAVAQIVSESGRIDVLVNNAGVAYAGLTEAFSEEQVLKQFDTNVLSMIRLNKAVLPHMRKKSSGLVINVTSVIARIVFPFYGLYCASKFAMEAISESLRYELAGLGVDSVILEPSAYPTPIYASTTSPADQEVVAEYGAIANLQNQIGEGFKAMFDGPNAPNPQDVADAVLRLIETPAGERPLRTLVGNDFGVNNINATAHAVQTGALQAFGLQETAQVKPLAKV
jgi:NAD(P)-dependent dehydrogenase (short-subunit alcohol dehydrogenase family)